MTDVPTMSRESIFEAIHNSIDFDVYPFSELSEKQLVYVLNIHHGPYLAAQRAGFGTPADAVKRLKRNDKVLLAVDVIKDVLVHTSIADSTEILQQWTSIMRDGTASHKDRLAAGTLLAKTRGMLTERLIVEKVEKREEIPYEPKPMILVLDDDTELIEG